MLAYTGTIYPGRQDPGPLIEALREIVADDPAARDELVVKFVGKPAPSVERQVREAGLSSIVEFAGEVPADRVDSIQRDADVLLLFGWPGSEKAAPVPTKAFEYLKASREILVVGEPMGSLAAHIVTTTGAGTVVHGAEEIRQVLERYRREFRCHGDVPYRGRPDLVAGYEFRGRSAEFFGLLDEVVGTARIPPRMRE